jgi:hypothetical protein
MRALFALIWLAGLATVVEGGEPQMTGGNDVIYLADMAAPPWSASANEQATSDHAGFEPCEEIVQPIASRIGNISARTYTTSHRWGKILRVRIASNSLGSDMLATCWSGVDGKSFIVVKVDDGKP